MGGRQCPPGDPSTVCTQQYVGLGLGGLAGRRPRGSTWPQEPLTELKRFCSEKMGSSYPSAPKQANYYIWTPKEYTTQKGEIRGLETVCWIPCRLKACGFHVLGTEPSRCETWETEHQAGVTKPGTDLV